MKFFWTDPASYSKQAELLDTVLSLYFAYKENTQSRRGRKGNLYAEVLNHVALGSVLLCWWLCIPPGAKGLCWSSPSSLWTLSNKRCGFSQDFSPTLQKSCKTYLGIFSHALPQQMVIFSSVLPGTWPPVQQWPRCLQMSGQTPRREVWWECNSVQMTSLPYVLLNIVLLPEHLKNLQTSAITPKALIPPCSEYW